MSQKTIASLVLVLGLVALAPGALAASKSVSFTNLKDGATVPLKVVAKFKVTGMKIVPAGQSIDDKGAGHFHVIIDGAPAKEGDVIPSDPTHLHFGKGQTESSEISLTPGKHTLTLQFADGLHRGYGSDLVQTITVTAK